MGSIGNNIINTFVDGQVVSATGSTGGSANALNPKMQIIQVANDDNNTRIGVLEGQIATFGVTQYNVKAAPYNAAGDGIVDDTTAIQAAITAASTNRGVVVFPYGTYKISNTLTITGNCSIQSTGDFSTATIKQITTLKSVFSIAGGSVSISNLTIDMYATNTVFAGSAMPSIATTVDGLSNITISRCQFISSSNNPFSVFSSGIITNVTLDKNVVTMSSSASALAISLRSCSNVYITQNRLTYTSGIVSIYRYGATSLATAPISQNIYIDRNISLYDTSTATFSLASVDRCYITNNQVTGNTSVAYTGARIVAISSTTDQLSNNVYNTNVYISQNTFDNTSCFRTHIDAVYTNRLMILNNDFIGGSSYTWSIYGAINLTNTIDHCLIDGNLFNAIGYDYANSAATPAIKLAIPKNVTISNNKFMDMIGNSTSGAGSCIYYMPETSALSTYIFEVSNNMLVRGTASASSVNPTGIQVGAGGATWTQPVLFLGNDFSKATTPFGGAPMIFCYYTTDSSGNKTYLTSTGSDPSPAYPTTGTWKLGDKTVTKNPAAGGYTGYVCTTAGTSGTWKGYGTIQS